MGNPEPMDADAASALWEAGAEKMREVYDGRVPVMPEGSMHYFDESMLELVALA